MADDEDEHDDGEVGGHVQAPAHAVVHHDLAAAPDQSEPSTRSAPPIRAEYWVRSTNESPPDVHEGEGVEDGEDDQREQVEDGQTQQGTHLRERTFQYTMASKVQSQHL